MNKKKSLILYIPLQVKTYLNNLTVPKGGSNDDRRSVSVSTKIIRNKVKFDNDFNIQILTSKTA